MRKTTLIILLLTSQLIVYAQMDTIIMFDIQSQTEQIIPIGPFDTITQSDFVPGFIGTWGDQINLNLTKPDSTPANTSFSSLTEAFNDFNLLKYPVRTSVAIVWYDSIYEQHATCSGSLIADNIVLTAAHCIGVINSIDEFKWKREGMRVSPSHSGGFPQPNIGKVKVERYIIPKKYYDGIYTGQSNDIGLLLLEEPIGEEIGYLGFGFQTDSLFYSEPIFYNFSYPGRDGYDGKEMYYYYGTFNSIDVDKGKVGHGGEIIQGMSGSNFFFTNNETSVAYGELTSYSGYTLIRREHFYAIKHIDENYNLGLSETKDNRKYLHIYPNPFVDKATIVFTDQSLSNKTKTIIIINSLGQTCRTISNIKDLKLIFERGNLKQGLYYILAYVENQYYTDGKLLVK